MNIRQPISSEAAVLAKYNRDAAREAGNPELNKEKSEKGVLAVIKDPHKGFYLVGEKEGKIVAMILITYEWSDWRNANWYLVQSVYTLPNFRKQKYFTKLLKKVEEIAQTNKNCCGLKLEVRMDNIRAKKVYKNLGFQDFEHEVWTKNL